MIYVDRYQRVLCLPALLVTVSLSYSVKVVNSASEKTYIVSGMR